MTIFLACAVLMGIAAAAYFVARGVERRRSLLAAHVDEFGREAGPGHIAVGVPVGAAFLISFGVVGWAALQLGVTDVIRLIAAGVLGGIVVGVLAAKAVSRWAAYAAQHDVPDARFVLQGHVATVIRTGQNGALAEIEYNANGRRIVVPARSLDDSPLPRGLEVVIERLEGGIVYVESWAHVEERL